MNCNFTHNYKMLLLIFLTAFLSCSDDGGDTPTPTPDPGPVEIYPSNLTLNVTVVGQDSANPNGDGSGKVICSASATDAVKYGFVFGTGSEIESTSGNIEYTYEDEGTKSYTIRVYAYSSTNNSVSASQGVTIFVKPADYSTLIFSDEFDVDGAPNSQHWGYDIGRGQNGWGNGESQYYTNRTDNVEVKDGTLRITAKRENYNGAEYTSTRMLTMDKFDFTYGKIEVRAKLPTGGGTWPAIWMLGANFKTVGWPECGEIDIMEHVGNNQGWVSSAMHTPSSYGGTINKGEQYLSDVSDEFHVYECLWTKDEIIFSVDGTEHYRYNPNNKNSSTWPYDAPQFIILNVAMGGSFGGTIDPAFTESTMEIDYVRVYQ